VITFPLLAHLHIFQLEGYSPRRFLNWWLKNPFNYQRSTKTSLKFTSKLKNLLLLSTLILVLISIPSYFLLSPTAAIVTTLIFLLTPFPLFFLALLALKPYEIINRRYTITNTRNTILSQKNLDIIGITGSYGKTSTKNFLYHILDHHHYSLKTPASYNTVFGIAKVIDLELVSRVDSFITEYGAYVRGEIKELTQMVPPTYGILTAIGSQHLERFKTLENTALAKFELIDAVNPQNALLNIDNDRIKNHLSTNSKYSSAKTYSFKDKDTSFFVTKHSLSPKGCSFTIQHQNRRRDFSTNLFGTSNLENLVAAVSMSLMLKVPVATIKKALSTLTPAPNRLELKTINNSTIIDNTYSSNVQGFSSILTDLGKLKGKKAILTPGIVELGAETESTHLQLGKLAGKTFNTFVLIGKSSRTDALAKGISSTNKKAEITFLSDHTQYWPTVEKLSQNHNWILLENDLTDNY